MKERRNVCGWLLRDKIAAARSSRMWTGVMDGENDCGNLLWHSCRTIYSPVTSYYTIFCATSKCVSGVYIAVVEIPAGRGGLVEEFIFNPDIKYSMRGKLD